MKNMKRNLSLVLALIMVFSLTACGKGADGESASQSELPDGQQVQEVAPVNELDWLNTDGTLPIVKEGTEKTLSIYACIEPSPIEKEETWLYKFFEEEMNINIELTTFTKENRNEFLSLAFAGGDLPDIIIGGTMTTAELLKYGATEGRIMDMAPYLNETYMPNLTKIYNENPAYKNAVTDTEGHVWSFGNISDATAPSNLTRYFINYVLLEELGIEPPETVDEFLEAMRAIKKAYPDMYPVGGSYVQHTPVDYFLNAFGFLINGKYTNGLTVSLRNGEVVLPVADREGYSEVLKFMRTLYEEELINPEFFTMDAPATEAVVTNGGNAFYYQAMGVYRDDYHDWWGAAPLTSEFNSTSQWPGAEFVVNCGNAVVSAECENPELAATFIDWFFTGHNYTMSMYGANCEEEPELLNGTEGWYVDDSGSVRNTIQDTNPNYNNSDYVNSMHIWPAFVLGYDAIDETCFHDTLQFFPDTPDLTKAYELHGHDKELLDSLDKQYMYAIYCTRSDRINMDLYPACVYLSEEETETVNYLLPSITQYAKAETAKFVTGQRSLDELDAYFDEIAALGADEYVQIYTDYYESIK